MLMKNIPSQDADDQSESLIALIGAQHLQRLAQAVAALPQRVGPQLFHETHAERVAFMGSRLALDGV